jgi:hypothetical protein
MTTERLYGLIIFLVGLFVGGCCPDCPETPQRQEFYWMVNDSGHVVVTIRGAYDVNSFTLPDTPEMRWHMSGAIFYHILPDTLWVLRDIDYADARRVFITNMDTILYLNAPPTLLYYKDYK